MLVEYEGSSADGHMERHAVIESCEGMLSQVLQMIIEKNYELPTCCDYHLGTLIRHLEGKDDAVVGEQLLELPIVKDWFRLAVEAWERNKVSKSVPICMFACQLIGLQSKKEANFAQYNSVDLYRRFIKLMEFDVRSIPPMMKLAVVRIARALLRHESGVNWLVSNDLWKTVVQYTLKNESLYVTHEGEEFVCDLLVLTLPAHQLFAQSMVMMILRRFYKDWNMLERREMRALDAGYKKSKVVMSMITHIMDNLLVREHETRGYHVVQLMVDFQLEQCVRRHLRYADEDDDYMYELHAILLHIRLFQVLVAVRDQCATVDVVERVESDVLEQLRSLMNEDDIRVVARVCHLAYMLWNRIPEEVLVTMDLTLQDRIVGLQIVPIIAPAIICIRDNHDDSECRELFASLHKGPVGLGQHWHSIVMSQEFGFDTSRYAVNTIRSLEDYQHRHGAILFKAIMYTIKDFMDAQRHNADVEHLLMEHHNFIICLLDAVTQITKAQDVALFDSVETVCIFKGALNCIDFPLWQSDGMVIIVHALKLVQLSIEKFLQVDMMAIDENTLRMLTCTMNTKLCDPAWEIRDSVLEIVHTIAKLANAQHALMLTLLLDLKIVPFVMTMVTADCHAYVRATATKCLTEIVQLPGLWISTLSRENVPQRMLYMIKNESEAVVRMHAINVIRAIYEFHFISERLMPEIYSVMQVVVYKDSHWEVKKNAINFWNVVVHKHLKEQGCANGVFPAFIARNDGHQTDIVAVTSDDIKERLHKLLRQLSENGCLGAFITAIEDGCDLEVSKLAVRKMAVFKDILCKYQLFDDFDQVEMATPMVQMPPDHPLLGVSMQIAYSSRTMEDVLNTRDISVLRNERGMSGDQVDNEPEPVTSASVRYGGGDAKMTPTAFIEYIRKDLNVIITQRKEWIAKMDGLENLLTNFLSAYNNEFTVPDCY